MIRTLRPYRFQHGSRGLRPAVQELPHASMRRFDRQRAKRFIPLVIPAVVSVGVQQKLFAIRANIDDGRGVDEPNEPPLGNFDGLPGRDHRRGRIEPKDVLRIIPKSRRQLVCLTKRCKPLRCDRAYRGMRIPEGLGQGGDRSIFFHPHQSHQRSPSIKRFWGGRTVQQPTHARLARFGGPDICLRASKRDQ